MNQMSKDIEKQFNINDYEKHNQPININIDNFLNQVDFLKKDD